MPRLDYFRKDTGRIDFHIRRDTDYWSAVRQLIEAFGKNLAYKQATRLFSVPPDSRSQAQFSLIFPEDWEIVVATGADEIDFAARHVKA